MKKIENPFISIPGYKCFGCAPGNEQGLQLSFYQDGDEIVTTWEPEDHHQGYLNVLHGGIQATLIDEIGSWVVFVEGAVAGVTSKLEVKYKKPVYVNEGKISLRAKLLNKRRNLYKVEVRLYNAKNEICALSEVTYFTFSPKEAEKRLNLPDRLSKKD